MDSIEEQGRRFVPSRRALAVEKVTGKSRLQDDLGLAGDDAVELFKEFEKEFETDCSVLWRFWGEHFAPEGGPSLLFALVLAGLFGAGFVLGTFQKWLPPWVWGGLAGHIFTDHGSNSAEAESKPYLILVSLDGFPYDYPRKYSAPNIVA